MTSLEVLFGRFRATRDPQALAAVFDATAAKLLLVATHLVGNRADAEDLVQTTFVEVIERADQWDASRPLEPWLVGVLANRAKMLLRRRRRDPTPRAGETAVTETVSPVDAAQANEIAQRVGVALARLPSHYRQVLTLHLVHGLSGVQIAQALERPPATVRTQIKRGLALLRETLPVSLAIPTMLLLSEGRGLAAVRAAVLEHAATTTVATATTAAAAAAAAVTATTAGGIVLMKNVLVALVACSIGAALWFAVARRPAPVEPARDTVARPATPMAAATEEADETPTQPAASPRRAVAEPPPATTDTIVRGRVVGAWNGQPQVARQIWIRAIPTDPTVRVANGYRSDTLCNGASRTDGTFELSFVADPGMRHSIEIYGDTFVGITGTLAVSGPGVCNLGDVLVTHGARIDALVVDEAGRPLPDVDFAIEVPCSQLGGVSRRGTGVTSDGQGRLRMRDDDRVPPGEASLLVEGPWQIVHGARFRIPDDSDTAEPTIVLRPLAAADTIAGRVVDRRGVGIGGVRLLAPGLEDRGFTSRDGSFRIFRNGNDGDARALSLDFVGSDTHVGVAGRTLVFGTQDASIVMEDAYTLPLRVVAADTGEPILDYKVFFGASDDPVFGQFDVAKHWRLGPHAAGRCELPGLPGSGTLSLMVLPADDDYEMSPQLTFALPRPRTEPIVVALLRKQPVHIEVVTADGEPVAGSQVQIIQSAGEETPIAGLSRQQAWDRMHPSRPAGWPAPFVVDEGTTGADGRVALRCARPNSDLAILVTGGHGTFRATGVALGASTFRAVVEPGARVRGRIVPADLIARCSRIPSSADAGRRLRVALRHPGGDIVRPAGSTEVGPLLPGDGTVALSGLDPGRWELVLAWDRPRGPSSWAPTVMEPPLASFDLALGETKDLGDLDAHALLPAVVRGRAFDGGVPIRDGLVTLTRRFADGSGTERTEAGLGGAGTDGDGRFELGGLLAGTYTLHVERVDADGNTLSLTSDPFPLSRGAEIDSLFELH